MIELNDVINQIKIDVFDPNRKAYASFLAVHQTFFKIDCTFEHKSSINTYNNINMIITCIISKIHGLNKTYTVMESEQVMTD